MSISAAIFPYAHLALWQAASYAAIILLTVMLLTRRVRNASQSKQQADYQRLQEECTEAVILQSLLLPEEKLLDELRGTQRLDIAYYFHPCSELGGDHIAAYRISDTQTALVMADFTGHGITAALYTFALHTLLEDKTLFAMKPGDALGHLNGKLHDVLMKGKFATMFFGVVDVKAQTLTYASAASPAPLLLQSGQVKTLYNKGFLLGAEKDATYTTHREAFRPGDLLLIYSDAFTETADKAGNSLSLDMIASLLKQPDDVNADAQLKRLVTHFFTRYSKQPDDDLSLLICRSMASG